MDAGRLAKMIALTLWLLAHPFTGFGQEELTTESIAERVKHAEADSTLDEDTRGRILELYAQATTALESASRFAGLTKEFRDAASGAATLQQELAKENFDEVRSLPLGVTRDDDVEKLESAVDQTSAELEKARQLKDELEKEPERRDRRRVEIRDGLIALQQRLTEIAEELIVASGIEAGALAEATRTKLQSEQRAKEAEIAALTQERDSFDVRRELLVLRLRKATRDVLEKEDQLSRLQALLASALKAKADLAVSEAREKEKRSEHPLLKDIRAQNTEIAEEHSKVLAAQEGTSPLTDELQRIQSRFESVKNRVAAIERIEGSPRFLITERMGLEDRVILRRLQTRQEKILEAEERRSQLLEIASRLESPDDVLAKAIENLPQDSRDAPDRVLTESKKGLAEQRTALEALAALYDDRYHRLLAINDTDVEIYATVTQLQEFIAVRLLWIRSMDPVEVEDFARLAVSVRWMASPTNWEGVGRTLLSDMASNPVGYVAASVPLVVGLLLRRRAKRRLSEISDRVSSFRTDRFSLSVFAIGWTVLQAAWLPLVLFLVGSRLEVVAIGNYFGEAIGGGLKASAIVLFPLLLLRRILRTGGLADSHFRWPNASLDHVRRPLSWLIVILVVTRFAAEAMRIHGNPDFDGSLGRLAFFVSMISIAVYCAIVFRIEGGLIRPYLDSRANTWVFRLRYLGYIGVIGIPLALSLTGALGYYYSALELTQCLLGTMWLLLFVVLLNALLHRWLFVARRSLAIEHARKRREMTPEEPTAETVPAPISEAEINVAELSAQAKQLISTVSTLTAILGTWFIWVDVLPALSGLRRHTLWSIGTGDNEIPITLGDLMIGLISMGLTLFAAGKIPALLEFTLLRNLPIKTGSRYAVVSLVKYAIMFIGITITFSSIGITWGKIQWLVAAMTVGLGFGLQEIFANFVSGLILLFERPVRVGDIVTVGTVTGEVSRIRIRATTIVDYDRKELLVPNKEFVTGQVTNWTLGDNVTRVIIPVGVAYGSDTELARDLLMSVAQSSPLVLEEPRPRAFFLSFGESTLNMELRIYLSSPDNIPTARHELHTKIDAAFKNAGIEIAFPQRDIHVRTPSPGSTPVSQDPPVSADTTSQ